MGSSGILVWGQHQQYRRGHEPVVYILSQDGRLLRKGMNAAFRSAVHVVRSQALPRGNAQQELVGCAKPRHQLHVN